MRRRKWRGDRHGQGYKPDPMKVAGFRCGAAVRVRQWGEREAFVGTLVDCRVDRRGLVVAVLVARDPEHRDWWGATEVMFPAGST